MNVFKLCASLKLDSAEYEKGLGDSETKMEAAGERIGAIASKIGDVLKTAAVVGGAALTAASAGVVSMVKTSVANFAEYEQTIGGVQKLYGNMGKSVEEYAQMNNKSVADVKDEWQKLENAQNTVLQNANQAYATAGMSANEYMSNATSFSAALINSLGGDTQKAAEVTDVAMRAISDNYNTFGGDMQNVTNAFQGFAKQNYTMLDNLKLGYGGTKEGMQQLIADANAYAAANGEAADLSIDSFADIVQAIELVQEKQGIAGTTAREAATTIEGSLGMVKGAWSNLVTGLASGEDISPLIDNVVNSATTAFNNLMPVIEQALTGVGDLIQGIAPVISKKLPEIAQTLIPELIETATTLIIAIAEALPGLASAIIDAIPLIFEQIVSIDWLGYGEQIVEAFKSAFMDAFSAFEGMDWSTAGTTLINGITNGLNTAMSVLGEVGGFGLEILTGICDTISTNLPTLLSTGSSILQNVLQGLIEKLPELIVWAGTAVATLWDTFMQSATTFFETGTEFLRNLIEGIASKLPDIVAAASNVVNQLLTVFLDNLPEILAMGANMLKELIAGIISILPDLIATALELVVQLLLTIGEQLPNILKAGIEILKNLNSGILNTIPELLAGTIKVLSSFLAKIAEWLPKILAAGITMLGKLVKGIIDSIPQIIDSAKEVADSFINKWKETDWLEIGIDAIKGIANGIRNGISWVISAAQDVVSSIWDTITGADGLDEHSPSKKLFGAGVNATLGLINGMNDKMEELEDTAYSMAASVMNPVGEVAGASKTAQAAQPYVIYLTSTTQLDGKVIAQSVNEVLGAAI